MVRVRVRFMVWVRGKCLGEEMSRGNVRHSVISPKTLVSACHPRHAGGNFDVKDGTYENEHKSTCIVKDEYSI